MATKIQRVKFDIPEGLSKEERSALADDIAEKIRKNAESGKGRSFDNLGTRNGIIKEYSNLPKYSPKYINSLDFKNAGKSPSNVDMTLSGDMLQSLEPVKITKNEIVLGFPDDQNGKADGNIRGTYGSEKPNPSKARNFLGLTESDFNKILKKYT